MRTPSPLARALSALQGLAALGVGLVVLLPLAYSFLVSLATPAEAFVGRLVPATPHWENYLSAWSAVPFGRYYLNTLVFALVSTFAAVFSSVLAAYAFARLQFPLQNLFFALFLATLMIPGHLTLIPNYLTLARLDLLDTFWALILPLVGNGYAVFLLRQQFRALPREIDESARIDGAGSWTILWRLVVPLSLPAIATTALFTLISRWNAYLWPLIATDSDATRTVQVGLARLMARSAEESALNWPVILAGSWIVLLPTLAFFLLADRLLLRFARLGALLR